MVSLEDKLAVQEVIAQYSYTYDAQDAEEFAALFTEDAVWERFAASARTRTMVLVTPQGITEAAPRPTASGVYYDQWRKTPEEWRLAHRILRRDNSA
jgi:hypothetical protein